MMEVDQPITENGLSKMSPNNADAVDSELGSNESIQQNGKPHKSGLDVAKSAVPVAPVDDDSNGAKGLEDEDTMERLMYTDLDDGEDGVLQPASADKPSDELVQNLSDTLIEDIIQLNKDSKRAESDIEADPDRLEQNEESSDIPPSSSGQSSNQTPAQEADGEDTNGVASAMEDESSVGLEEDLIGDDASETKGVADIDEESESILLQEEDNHDLEDELDVDEHLLLDEDVEMEEGGSTQGSAIQIDDSAAVCEIVEGSTVEVTDGSVTIDESGLSILNTAAVDIGDMTVDDSVVVDAEPKLSLLVSSDVENLAAIEKSVELSTETAEVNEMDIMAPPPVDLDIDPPSPDISDLIKFPDALEKRATIEKTEEKDVVPEVSDLIKFPDDSCTAEIPPPVRSPTPELSDLIKFDSVTTTAAGEEQSTEADNNVVSETIESASGETTLVQEAPMETSEQVEVELPEIPPVEEDESKEEKSSEKEQESVTLEKEVEVASVDSNKHVPADSPLLSEKNELVETLKDGEKNKCEEKEDKVASDKTEDSPKGEKNEDNKESEIEDNKESENEDNKESENEDNKESEGNEDEAKQKKDVCPQALQAADEEDLLEMMEEPERMDNDDEQPDEDLDDNSSESGSTKQNEDGEEDDDYEGSDYMGADEDESSRNVDDQDEAVGENVHVEEQEGDEGEPPMKRKCSVDVRETHAESDVEAEKRKGEETAELNDEKAVEETVEKAAEEKVEKEVEEESPKSIEAEGEKSESQDKLEKKTEKSTESAKKEPIDEASAEVETTEKDSSKVESEESKKEDVPSEKEDEKMDISQEESLVVEKSKEDLDAKIAESHETEKKLEAEDKEEKKKEAQVCEKSEPVPDEKDVKKVEEVAKGGKLEEATESESKETAKVAEKWEEKEPTPAEKSNDEVLVIDDDDDEVAVSKKEDNAEKKAEKRPCPEDDTEDKDKSETAKKIRLSVEEKDKKEGDKPEELKEEPKAEVQAAKKDEKKSILEEIEPLKVTLEPEPVAPKEKKSIRLEFLEKFKKPLEKMNRSNLEDFVLQKIVEGIAFKSAIAEMRTQLDAQDTLLQGYRQKVHDLNKQFRDLEMVHERVVKDLEKKNQHFITPVKITRAVGLQVSQPRYMAGNRPSISSAPSVANSPKNTVNRSPVATPPGGSPNKNAPQNNVQIRRPRINSNPSTTATQKSPAQQPAVVRQVAPTILNKTIASPQNSMLNKTTTLQGQVSPLNNTQQVQTQASLPATKTPPPTPGGTTPITRKKPLQKFTPMRPPLSITQQVQQQQQTRQMQEQLMRQQIQEVQTSNSGGHSPLAQSPQGSPLTRTPEPALSPAGTPVNRTPQMVMKKVITPQAKATPTSMQALNRPTPSMVTSNPVRSAPSTATPAAVDNSLIDLTDEDDAPKPAAVAAASVVPKPPITILNGQQPQPHQQQQQHHQQPQYTQRQAGMPPLVVINQQRMMTRPTLQQRPAGMINGAPPRPVLMQRPATNGFPRQTTYRARMINGQIGAPRGMIVRAPIRQPAAVTFTHPAPLPQPGTQLLNPSWKQTPPRPSIRINNIETGIVISWTMDDLSDAHATIVSYQIYAYQETNAPPSMDMWRHVGDVKAMLLPMAVTLTQFQEGQRYHFAVRAVDEHQRVGQFSPPRTWNESTPAKV